MSSLIFGGVFIDGKWKMPKPVRMLMHFKSEGTRRAYLAGTMDRVTAIVEVPLYRGVDREYYRSLRPRRHGHAELSWDQTLKRNKRGPYAVEVDVLQEAFDAGYDNAVEAKDD